MQILSTINSIIRLKLCTQINLHFKTATYIFLQHIPYSYIDTIFMQNFLTIFSSRHAHFSTSIKCKKSCIFIVEYFPSSEDITIFASIWHETTAFDLYTGYIPVSCRKMSADVKSWSLMSNYLSLHFPSILILYHLIKKVNKNFSTNSCKIRRVYYSMIHLKCQEIFIASFPIIRHCELFNNRKILHDKIRHISPAFFDIFFRHCSATFLSKIFLSKEAYLKTLLIFVDC